MIALVAALGLLASCTGGSGSDGSEPTKSAPSDIELTRQGGTGTVNDDGISAFSQSLVGLTHEERRTFAVGNSFFNQNWVTAPASTEARDGLGPIFNAQSCSSCHFKDGRGQPPADSDDPERGLLIRLSVLDDDGRPIPHPELGDQFQDRAIRGIESEGSVRIDLTDETGTYPDGTEYSLAAPSYTLVRPDGTEVDDVLISPRVAPAMMGVGLLENVPAADIEARADPHDSDDDGISGRAHMVPDTETGEEVLGRFGWKAAVATLKDQNSGAAGNDIGITSTLVSEVPCTPSQTECLAAPDGGDPEMSDERLDEITFYTRTLAVPARRDVGKTATTEGQELFTEVGCADCHTAEMRTGPSDIEPLADQVIRPYTDLLLHDMGAALADDRPDGDASGREWRTPPLWGIGLVETVNRHTRFMHDGRARSIEEAILWHGGEAKAARQRFMKLPKSDRQAVLTFLESL